MKISYLPSGYLINGLRKLEDIQRVESTIFLRAVRIVNDSPNKIKLTQYKFDIIRKSKVLQSIVYNEEQIKNKAEDVAKTIERLTMPDQAKLFMGAAEFWKGENYSSEDLDPNQETGFRTEHFSYMDEEPIDQLKFTVFYLENNEERKEEVLIPIKQYECKNDYIFPLKGAWIPVNTYDNPYEHRRMHSQEFAFDLVKTDGDMRVVPEISSKNEDSPYYAEEVIAAADGEVVDLFETFPENPGAGEMLSQEEMQELYPTTGYFPIAAGNYVVIKHQGDECTFYAHLIPNSLKVKKGDKVKQGEVIGLLGNSGNSTAAHLHFQLQLGSDPMTARGLPCKFVNLTGLEGEKIEIIDKNFSIVYSS